MCQHNTFEISKDITMFFDIRISIWLTPFAKMGIFEAWN